jgi:hypothetical protein
LASVWEVRLIVEREDGGLVSNVDAERLIDVAIEWLEANGLQTRASSKPLTERIFPEDV